MALFSKTPARFEPASVDCGGMTQEHYRKYLVLRRARPEVIGPIWIEHSGFYIRPLGDIGDPEPISGFELARLIDRLWRNSQMMLPLEKHYA